MFITSPGICLITNSRQYSISQLDSQLEAIDQAVHSSCDYIQIREKHLTRDKLKEFSSRVVDLAGNTSTRIILNRDWELAIELGIWGAHLNSDQSFPSDTGGLTIGVSCHTLEDALRAQDSGADYIFLGPVFPPNSKASDFVLGPQSFSVICSQLDLPVFALGGMTVENAATAILAGASGIAGIGLFAIPEQVAPTISALRLEMNKAAELPKANVPGRND